MTAIGVGGAVGSLGVDGGPESGVDGVVKEGGEGLLGAVGTVGSPEAGEGLVGGLMMGLTEEIGRAHV